MLGLAKSRPFFLVGAGGPMGQHQTATCCMLSLLFGICLFAGCQSIRNETRPARFAYEHQCEQIVLHSDFELTEQQRLVDELCAQRELLAGKLGLPTTDMPIHIYLFADDRSYYDFLDLRFHGFPHRRAIFVETEVELAVYAHWGDHIAEDLRHEVTHGYLHAALPRLPLWLDEGLAEYFEVGSARQGLNAPHLDQLRGLENFRPNLPRLEQLSSAAEMTQLDYAESWAWVHFLLESDVDKAALLTDYLADLQQGSAATLSTRLQKRLADAESALVEHLQTLR
jgi:hypothetical protein